MSVDLIEGVEEKMDLCAMQQNAFATCEETRSPSGERRHPVLCPMPRRLSELSAVADAARAVRWQASCQADASDSKAGAELMEIFLSKGGEVASSPPFFSGSPPSRAANPVVHDARFGEDRPLPFPSGSSPMSPRKGCARAKFGLNPAAVRIEGFDCRLAGRDGRRITAMA